jgi:hypothetical protein
MSSFEQLVCRFLHSQDNITTGDVRRLVNYFAYKEHKSPGSHIVFRSKGKFPIIAPTVKGRYIKKQYVKKIVNILNLEEYIEKPKRG